jgi:hypothetical protein
MMTCITCGECKHWTPISAHRPEDIAANAASDFKLCALAENGDPQYEENINLSRTLALAHDGEHYRACLETHRSFGCVQGVLK